MTAMKRKYYDVIVVGMGAGGIGAALELVADKNLKIAVIEKETRIGGTMIQGGVNCFEPGIAVGRVQRTLGEALMNSGLGRVQRSLLGYPCAGQPYAISVDCADGYKSTLRRGILDERKQCRRFAFEPSAMEAEILRRLREGGAEIYTGTTLVDATVRDRKIESVTVLDATGNLEEFTAKYYLDCTGNVSLAYACGCKTTIGQESRSVFNESIAPVVADGEINGVSLVFRISKSVTKEYEFDETVCQTDVSEWENEILKKNRVVFCANTYPNGDFNINMLPTMTGKEYFSMPQETAKTVCMARVRLFSKYLQCFAPFKEYRLKSVFPIVGIREDRKIVGKYVLTLHDVLTAPKQSTMRKRFIAYADHIVDMHGCSGERPPIKHAYGIPYECLQTNEIDNLLVASKGASFSHIAASSCRLSRTIMDMGEAAAKACKTALAMGIPLHEAEITVPFLDDYETIGMEIKE